MVGLRTGVEVVEGMLGVVGRSTGPTPPIDSTNKPAPPWSKCNINLISMVERIHTSIYAIMYIPSNKVGKNGEIQKHSSSIKLNNSSTPLKKKGGGRKAV